MFTASQTFQKTEIDRGSIYRALEGIARTYKKALYGLKIFGKASGEIEMDQLILFE